MNPDHWLRGILTAQALAALLLTGGLLGHFWPRRAWPTHWPDPIIWPLRIVMLGAFLALAYVFAGQIKAFNLDIPVDGVSALGLAAYTLILSGSAWLAARHRRGR